MGNRFSRDTIYQEITDKIIGELERGIMTWVQPWTARTSLAPLSLPRNAFTKRNYSVA